jgi:hypothetical protein
MRPMISRLIASTSSMGSLYAPSTVFIYNVSIFEKSRLGVLKHTVQFLFIKFLKYKAPANRKVVSKELVATTCNKSRENPGLVSAALNVCSASLLWLGIRLFRSN